MMTIVRRYTKEAGVRSLERQIASVLRKIAKEVLKKGKDIRVKVTSKLLIKYLGVPPYRYGKSEEKEHIGMAMGLAWTEVGGELLSIEVALMPGKGKLIITGKLGDVMQESAQAAMTYIRSRAVELGLDKDFYQKLDIHIHVPEGAIPKDGPSAGVTMATAIASALLKIPVRNSVAMTGEITLRGNVLPIGGLKEKMLAAHRAGMKLVVIPKENEKDLRDIPSQVLKKVEVLALDNADDFLVSALKVKDKASLFKEKPEEFVKGSKKKASADEVGVRH
jgi:ATP-dependent Lon protease